MSVIIDGSAGVTTNSGAVYNSIQSGTAVSASGTSIDFTSIPSWVKRITVMFDGVSTNGSSVPIIQLGDAGGFELTGYISTSTDFQGAGLAVVSQTTGLSIVAQQVNTYANVGSYTLSLLNLATNTWTGGGNFVSSSVRNSFSAGSKSLSATLDRVRITTVNGTDTFDAGSINILYE
jgi:hypothetical protein